MCMHAASSCTSGCRGDDTLLHVAAQAEAVDCVPLGQLKPRGLSGFLPKPKQLQSGARYWDLVVLGKGEGPCLSQSAPTCDTPPGSALQGHFVTGSNVIQSAQISPTDFMNIFD